MIELSGRSRLSGYLTGWFSANRSDLLILGGLWLLATLIYWWLANGHVTLRRYQDEYLFWETAQSFIRGDGLSWRGVNQGITPLYIIYISIGMIPGWETIATYKMVHLLNAMAMPAVIFPVYFVARRYVDRKWAYAAALLTISIAAMNYVGVVGTENIAYPIAALTFGALALAIARPQRRFWIAAVALLGVSFFTRTQFLGFVVILPLAIFLIAVLQVKGERRAFLTERREPLFFFGAATAIVLILLAAAPSVLLGIYTSGLDFPSPSAADLWYWLKGFTANVFLMTGIVPALAALALMMDRENWRRDGVNALLAVTLISTMVMVGQVTWFSATNPYDWEARHIFYERYIFYAAPMIMVAFVAFFRWGKAVPLYIATGITAVSVALFDANHVLVPFSYDAFGLTLIGDILKGSPGFSDWVGTTLAVIVVLSGVVLFFTTDRERAFKGAAWAAVAIAAGSMLWSQGKSWSYAHENSEYAKLSIPAPVDFIDQSTDDEVGMIITATDSPEMYFSTEFWNDRVTRAFVLPNSPIVYSPTCPFQIARDGEVSRDGCAGAMLRAFYLRSETIRMTFRNLERSIEPAPGVRLMVAGFPPRLAGVVIGRQVTTGSATGTLLVRTFASRPAAALVVRFANTPGATVKVKGRSYSLDAADGRKIELPVATGDALAEFEVVDGNGTAAETAVESVELREPGAPPIDLIG